MTARLLLPATCLAALLVAAPAQATVKRSKVECSKKAGRDRVKTREVRVFAVGDGYGPVYACRRGSKRLKYLGDEYSSAANLEDLQGFDAVGTLVAYQRRICGGQAYPGREYCVANHVRVIDLRGIRTRATHRLPNTEFVEELELRGDGGVAWIDRTLVDRAAESYAWTLRAVSPGSPLRVVDAVKSGEVALQSLRMSAGGIEWRHEGEPRSAALP